MEELNNYFFDEAAELLAEAFAASSEFSLDPDLFLFLISAKRLAIS